MPAAACSIIAWACTHRDVRVDVMPLKPGRCSRPMASRTSYNQKARSYQEQATCNGQVKKRVLQGATSNQITHDVEMCLTEPEMCTAVKRASAAHAAVGAAWAAGGQWRLGKPQAAYSKAAWASETPIVQVLVRARQVESTG